MSSDAAAHGQRTDRYFVPEPSAWPFVLTFGLALTVLGVGRALEGRPMWEGFVIPGVPIALWIIYRWCLGVARESERGAYNLQVDRTFRWAMSFFIFSEVMFFGGFFGALFYARVLSVPWLSGAGAKLFTGLQLWPDFTSTWPSNGPGHVGGAFQTIPPWGVPFLNTLCLLTSGVTITYAHHKLREGKRGLCIVGMIATIALGSLFLRLQAGEYIEAYTKLNLTLHSGVYGSTFFMLTGFHGLHVTLGTLMLIIITIRLAVGHFTPDHHFGFEGVAWYWHFVDVVWVGLFVLVYIL